MINWTEENDIATLTMEDGENRWNTSFVRRFEEVLDEIEAKDNIKALVTCSSDAKFFSNGLDLEWLQSSDPDHRGGDKAVFGAEFMALMGRIITYPIPTICAINGHGFGAGFMVALCHDVRIMREDRGFLCANEMQLGFTIPKPELVLFRHKMSGSAYFETVQLAKRWTAGTALAAGVIHQAVPLEELAAAARATAEAYAPLGNNRELYGGQKEAIFGENAILNSPHGAAHLLKNANDYR